MSIKYHYDLLQGTDEWLQARLGIVTASIIKNLITPTGEISKAKTVDLFACQVASERITQRIEPHFVSYDMERGHLEEVVARDLYSDQIGQVSECGFVTNDDLGFKVGFSPDGLVGEEGLIEIKSRMPKFQIETFVYDKVPEEYMLQLQTGLFVTKRKWIDFIQYSNGMPLFIKRVMHDPEMQATIKEALEMFEEKVVAITEIFKYKSKDAIKAPYVELAMD